MANLGPVDYTSRDYDAFLQSMLDRIPRVMPEWTAPDENDFGVVLLELFASSLDILSYTADRVANEAFISTATQRASILNLATLLDYTPAGTSAATTTLEFTVAGNLDVTIPAGTRVSTNNSSGDPVTFETDSDIVVSTNGDAATPQIVSISATEGSQVTYRQIGTSCGVANEYYTIPDTPVVESTIYVFVKADPTAMPALWLFVSHLIDSGPHDHVYTTFVDSSGNVSVEFGDGVNGLIPPPSSLILANYRVGGGVDGNVGADTISFIEAPQSGVQKVTNPDPASGGADAESIESIRVNAPRALTALKRAVSLSDYSALALQIPGVAKSNATSVVYTNVTVWVAPVSGAQPTQALMQAVTNYFGGKTLPGVTVVPGAPEYPTFDLAIDISVATPYVRETVSSQVSSALQSAFSFDNASFGQRVSLSDIYHVINSVAGVDYGVVTLLARTGFTGVNDVVFIDYEIPALGTVNLTTSGGILQAGAPTGVPGVSPGVPGAPTIDTVSCGTTSMHVEAHWIAGTDNTSWNFEAIYRDAGAHEIAVVQVGPLSVPSVIQDFPNIGNPSRGVTSVEFRALAFNSGAGPAAGSVTSISYTCG